ncbi:ankyrin repeat-containing domain protein [Obelidium mucronatum]|nr:ankyrin repeat-containing domain protein [Obelidium mucronatum]
MLLPVSHDLIPLALASKSRLASAILHSPSFARRHFNHSLKTSSLRIWEYLEATNIKYEGFLSLPNNYKHIVYHRVLSAEDWSTALKIVDRSQNLMWSLRWNMPPNRALETITTLLQSSDYKLNPAVNNNRLIQWSSRNGHYQVVKLLLSSYPTLVDPSSVNDLALEAACSFGHVKIVKLLLTDPRVSPTCRNSAPLCFAADNGSAQVVQALLDDGRSNPAAYKNLPLRQAVKNNHIQVVQLLLNDERVDPGVGALQNAPIIEACQYGFVEITRLLLKHPLVDPTFNNNECLVLALKHGHDDVVEILNEDGRVCAGNIQTEESFPLCSFQRPVNC